MTKKISEMTPEEAEAKRKYQREWARKHRPPKKQRAAKKAPKGTTILQINPLRNGDDPGEAFFYIADSLQVMYSYLRRICEACEKAQGI